jgi:hypothetical protein
MVIEGVFVRNPMEVFYKLCMLLQKWKARLKSADQESLEEGVKKIRRWIEDFSKKAKEREPKDFFI